MRCLEWNASLIGFAIFLVGWWNSSGYVRWFIVALGSVYGLWPLSVCLCSPALLPGYHELSILSPPCGDFLHNGNVSLLEPAGCGQTLSSVRVWVSGSVLATRKPMHPSSPFTGKTLQIGNHIMRSSSLSVDLPGNLAVGIQCSDCLQVSLSFIWLQCWWLGTVFSSICPTFGPQFHEPSFPHSKRRRDWEILTMLSSWSFFLYITFGL